MVYLNDSCDPLETEHPFELIVYPERAEDLPEARREQGREWLRIDFHRNGAFVDGGCVAFFPLPDYPIASIRTGQSIEGGGEWRAGFAFNAEPYRLAYEAAVSGEPLARGAFDVHMADGALVYVKKPCEQGDTDAKFFLHIRPERVGDLPEERRGSGFDNLDFDFFPNGALFDGRCAARVPLPDYPIASIRTGQHAGGAGELWRSEFEVERQRAALVERKCRHSRVGGNDGKEKTGFCYNPAKHQRQRRLRDGVGEKLQCANFSSYWPR